MTIIMNVVYFDLVLYLYVTFGRYLFRLDYTSQHYTIVINLNYHIYLHAMKSRILTNLVTNSMLMYKFQDEGSNRTCKLSF